MLGQYFWKSSEILGLADFWWYFEISFITVYNIIYSFIYATSGIYL